MVIAALLASAMGCKLVLAANPLVPGIGMADPHMHVFPYNPDVVQLYSTHDCNKGRSGPCVREPIEPGNSAIGAASPNFRMIDWWVWSSSDLVNWKLETKVLPKSIKWDDVNASQECWATDAASFPNGTTAFYLSVGPKQIGVVTGPTPNGPFADPLGKPLIPIGMVPTYSRDPTVLMDDDGTAYLCFGTFVPLLPPPLPPFHQRPSPGASSPAPRAAVILLALLTGAIPCRNVQLLHRKAQPRSNLPCREATSCQNPPRAAS